MPTNINLLIYNINEFKKALVNYADSIKLNDDQNWEADDVTMSDNGDLEFKLHSRAGEGDFFYTTLNMKLFSDDRVIENHLANCRARMQGKNSGL
ncbi:hypothetical protein phiAS5_ORF0287 [Aeromonas phage phiAS5]|uniref:Uncharacterized protein n=1 Tax=Aeromonas phage phiAS5 TaxID=879630 RepID=E1A241_9CAUD|nr:hypothetical protein phiAS5_ORF0287 [Aeromonas phage phiAS5]ADM80130.1 hypothetical protein phiAS5_ORF0287 [Aeromonas phage phiAS5]BES53108.1 hypothetical protein [Aeromonas phage phiWae14]